MFSGKPYSCSGSAWALLQPFPFQAAGRAMLNGLYPKAKAKGKAKAKAMSKPGDTDHGAA